MALKKPLKTGFSAVQRVRSRGNERVTEQCTSQKILGKDPRLLDIVVVALEQPQALVSHLKADAVIRL